MHFLSVANLQRVRYFSSLTFACFDRRTRRSSDRLYSAVCTTTMYDLSHTCSYVIFFHLSMQSWPPSAVSAYSTCQRASFVSAILPQACVITRQRNDYAFIQWIVNNDIPLPPGPRFLTWHTKKAEMAGSEDEAIIIILCHQPGTYLHLLNECLSTSL